MVILSEIKTLNGYSFVDTKAREDITTLAEAVDNGTGSVHPDWNENDPASKAYVQNRTHWTESVESDVELFPETTLTAESKGSITTPLATSFIAGETATVTYNGTVYACEVCELNMGDEENPIMAKWCGNPMMLYEDESMDNGIPFIFLEAPPIFTSEGIYAMFVPLDSFESGDATVKATVKREEKIFHPLDYRFISTKYEQPVWGTDKSGKVVLPEMTLTGEGGELPIMQPFELDEGKAYKVKWNGTDYICTTVKYAMDGLTMLYLGNLSAMTGGTGTGEPFIIVQLPSGLVEDGAYGAAYSLDEATSAVLSIVDVSGTVHKIPLEYLDVERTHWENKEDVTIYDNETIQFDGNGEGALFTKPKTDMLPGITYTVTWNGTEYQAECQTVENHVYYKYTLSVDNVCSMIFLKDEVIPLLKNTVALVQAAATGETESVTFSIIEPVGTVHKLDAKYLPASAGGDGTAEEAKTLATQAQTTAESAHATATEAQTSAESAQATATEAQSTAQNALSTSNSALNTANAATEVAYAAQAAAEEAKAIVATGKDAVRVANVTLEAAATQIAFTFSNPVYAVVFGMNTPTPGDRPQVRIKFINDSSTYGIHVTTTKMYPKNIESGHANRMVFFEKKSGFSYIEIFEGNISTGFATTLLEKHFGTVAKTDTRRLVIEGYTDGAIPAGTEFVVYAPCASATVEITAAETAE